jgi:hypothetical protein
VPNAVDYRKVNVRIIFYSYPLTMTDHAFQRFAGAVFSVLDSNSAYYQSQLSPCIAPLLACMSLISYTWRLVFEAKD